MTGRMPRRLLAGAALLLYLMPAAAQADIFSDAMNGDASGIEHSLELGQDINAADSNRDTALHIAAAQGRDNAVELLLSRGARVDLLNDEGRTALHLAALEGRRSIVELLLAHGADPESRGTEDGMTPLFCAVQKGHADTAKFLLSRGADPNTRDAAGRRPLLLAVLNGDAGMVQILAEGGADPNAHDGARLTPLLQSIEMENRQIAEILLVHGAKPAIVAKTEDGQELVSLHMAARHGMRGTVRMLLDHGMDVNGRLTEDGMTPLHYACMGGWPGVSAAMLLIERGADVNAAAKNNDTPLHYGCFHAGLTDALIARGADVNAVNGSGQTPLHRAAQLGGEGIATLLAHGAMVNARDLAGRTPLIITASREENLRAASLMLEHGADAHAADRQGRTALHQPTLSSDMADLLLQYDADVNAQDCFGDTPLHFAARRGNARLAETLLAHGADPRLKNKNGKMALDVCRTGGETASLLEQAVKDAGK